MRTIVGCLAVLSFLIAGCVGANRTSGPTTQTTQSVDTSVSVTTEAPAASTEQMVGMPPAPTDPSSVGISPRIYREGDVITLTVKNQQAVLKIESVGSESVKINQKNYGDLDEVTVNVDGREMAVMFVGGFDTLSKIVVLVNIDPPKPMGH